MFSAEKSCIFISSKKLELQVLKQNRSIEMLLATCLYKVFYITIEGNIEDIHLSTNSYSKQLL